MAVSTRIIRQARKLIVGAVGSAIVLIGLAMIVLPGPAFIMIPLGLGILAIEFEWARHLLKKVKAKWRKRERRGESSHNEKDQKPKSGGVQWRVITRQSRKSLKNSVRR
jgi:hypothetical protein